MSNPDRKPKDDLNPRRELFRRYGEVFRTAWSERNENRRSRRYTSVEADFLPASLAVSDRPTPIMPHVAQWSLSLLVLVLIGWAMIGRIDVVVMASGKVLAHGKSKSMQSLESQLVRRIFVVEGQTVSQGEPLVEFDRTSAEADLQRSIQDFRRAEAVRWAYQTLLDSVGDTPSVKDLVLPQTIPVQDSALAQATALVRWEEHRSKVARGLAEASRRRSERHAIELSIEALTARLAYQKSLLSDYRALVKANAAPRHQLIEQEVRTIDLANELSKSTQQRQQLDLAIAESEAAIELNFASDKANWRERIIEAHREATSAIAERRKAEYRLSTNVLEAPTAGRVQQMLITAPGAIVTAGQTVMTLVPLGEVEEVEALVENRDVGFLRVGQQAEIKLEPFDYTRYGTIPAVLSHISADAVADDRGVLRYPVRLRLKRSRISVGDRAIELAPGMSATVDIMSGHRSILSYFLSPIVKTTQEALRER